jgi:hypothetical protein
MQSPSAGFIDTECNTVRLQLGEEVTRFGPFDCIFHDFECCKTDSPSARIPGPLADHVRSASVIVLMRPNDAIVEKWMSSVIQGIFEIVSDHHGSNLYRNSPDRATPVDTHTCPSMSDIPDISNEPEAITFSVQNGERTGCFIILTGMIPISSDFSQWIDECASLVNHTIGADYKSTHKGPQIIISLASSKPGQEICSASVLSASLCLKDRMVRSDVDQVSALSLTRPNRRHSMMCGELRSPVKKKMKVPVSASVEVDVPNTVLAGEIEGLKQLAILAQENVNLLGRYIQGSVSQKLTDFVDSARVLLAEAIANSSASDARVDIEDYADVDHDFSSDVPSISDCPGCIEVSELLQSLREYVLIVEDAFDGALNNWNHTRADLEERNANLEEKCHQYHNLLQSKNAEMQSLEDENAQQQRYRSFDQEAMNQLKVSLKESKTEQERLAVISANLEDALSKYQQENTNLKTSQEALMSSIARLEEGAESLKMKAASDSDRMDEMLKQSSVLKAELEKLGAELEMERELREEADARRLVAQRARETAEETLRELRIAQISLEQELEVVRSKSAESLEESDRVCSNGSLEEDLSMMRLELQREREAASRARRIYTMRITDLEEQLAYCTSRQ